MNFENKKTVTTENRRKHTRKCRSEMVGLLVRCRRDRGKGMFKDALLDDRQDTPGRESLSLENKIFR